MKTFPTSYGREDGKVDAIRTRNGWALRSIRGPAWFWNHTTQRWCISSVSGFDFNQPCFLMTEEQALELLSTINPVG